MTEARPSTGTMVYGVVPEDVEPTSTALGVGDPPAPITTVTYRDLAALVSEVPLDRPLGRPADLTAYQKLLDGTATVAPVLPIRFGTVLDGADAVRQLLTDRHDEIAAMLDRLEGRVEFLIRGRYVEQTILRQILRDVPEVRELRDEIHGRPEAQTTQLRMRLGEIINNAIESSRAADTQAAAERLKPLVDDVVVRDPTHELEAVHLAVLVDDEQRPEFDRAIDELTDEWQDRVAMRRLGPLAPYDFVSQLAPAG